jgi:ribosome-associated protein
MTTAVLSTAAALESPGKRDREAAFARSRAQACEAARACEARRGQQTLVLDVSRITPLFDFFVITTGTNPRQMRAIADAVDETLEHLGTDRQAVDGRGSGAWVVQDYGDIVLHVFSAEARKHYDLENLWADAVQVDWESE